MNTTIEKVTADKNKPLLVVIVGPTAVGKTKYGLALAQRFNSAIISGDSMQVYRQMDIGTAKPSLEERGSIPHYLIDVKDASEPFTVADFQYMADEAITHITEQGRIPIIVGGTGLYIESLIYGFNLNPVGSDERYREQLAEEAQRYGNEVLHEKLKQVDPPSAARIHANDVRRVIRALEVYHLTGKPFSDERRGKKKESFYKLCLIGLTMDRAMLYKRIEERIDLMIEQGLVDEVKQLLAQGYTLEHTAMQAIGYKEIIRYLQGEYDLDRAIYLLKRDTRRFAKRQLSWFRKMEHIYWLDVSDAAHFDSHLETLSGIIEARV